MVHRRLMNLEWVWELPAKCQVGRVVVLCVS